MKKQEDVETHSTKKKLGNNHIILFSSHGCSNLPVFGQFDLPSSGISRGGGRFCLNPPRLRQGGGNLNNKKSRGANAPPCLYVRTPISYFEHLEPYFTMVWLKRGGSVNYMKVPSKMTTFILNFFSKMFGIEKLISRKKMCFNFSKKNNYGLWKLTFSFNFEQFFSSSSKWIKKKSENT